ncbi:MAG TPA: hypothetical protein VL523_00860 [Terriglobia bacterium]|nr:hypothetical protein [Terriglobia bacterium]
MPLLERGVGLLKSIFTLAILAAIVFAGIQTVPVYFGNYELSNYIRDRAVQATVERPSPEDLQNEVVHYARQIGLPVQPEDVQATSVNGNVSIRVDYSVPVNLGVYTWNAHFTPSAENQAF